MIGLSDEELVDFVETMSKLLGIPDASSGAITIKRITRALETSLYNMGMPDSVFMNPATFKGLSEILGDKDDK